MFVILILISTIALASTLEPTGNIEQADSRNKNIMNEYLARIPDIEEQYIIDERLTRAISHFFKGKISSLPLYRVSLKINRTPVKIPWTLGDAKLEETQVRAQNIDKGNKHVQKQYMYQKRTDNGQGVRNSKPRGPKLSEAVDKIKDRVSSILSEDTFKNKSSLSLAREPDEINHSESSKLLKELDKGTNIETSKFAEESDKIKNTESSKLSEELKKSKNTESSTISQESGRSKNVETVKLPEESDKIKDSSKLSKKSDKIKNIEAEKLSEESDKIKNLESSKISEEPDKS